MSYTLEEIEKMLDEIYHDNWSEINEKERMWKQAKIDEIEDRIIALHKIIT